MLAGLVASLSACGTVPKFPAINMYLLDLPRNQALCSNTETGTCAKKPLGQMDKAIMITPADWEKVQNWIDGVTCQLQGGCKMLEEGNPLAMSSGGLEIQVEDVALVRSRLSQVKKDLDRQRSRPRQ